MALAFIERLGLNAREQRLATALVWVVGVMLLLGLPLGMQSIIWSRHAGIEKARAALEAVQGARGQMAQRRARLEGITARYSRKAPALAGFIEQLARSNKLEVTDSVDRPDVPVGKHFVERSTTVHLKKASMLPIAKFLEAVEKSGHPVVISRLDLRKRAAEQDSYDVEVTLTAYDRKETPKPAASAAASASTKGAEP